MEPRDVLVVDDDPEIRETLKEFLTSEGFRVRCAESAFDAIAMLCAEAPDVILLDLKLPDLEGHFVISRVCANSEWFDVPIIVISACADQDNRALAKALGARDYLMKPFDL